MIETNCGQCRHYAKLENPFQYGKSGYPEGVTVYGFCGKNAATSFYFYPVYIPDGGTCKEFKRRSGLKAVCDTAQDQLMMEGYGQVSMPATPPDPDGYLYREV